MFSPLAVCKILDCVAPYMTCILCLPKIIVQSLQLMRITEECQKWGGCVVQVYMFKFITMVMKKTMN